MVHPIKQVAAVHDLSGFGRASLTVVIPVLSAMGVQVCPLPTSILSTNCTFEGYYMNDFTKPMEAILNHWKKMNLKFDAIYTGFLGSPEQVPIVERMIDDFSKQNTLVVVDPVLADEGELYSSYNMDMVKAMRSLYKKARIITPNLTEMFFLLDEPYNPYPGQDQLRDYILQLSQEGPEVVVVSSISERENDEYSSVIAYDRCTEKFWKVSCEYIPASYPGTGDVLASVIIGSLLQGDSLPLALDRAIHFISYGIRSTFGYDYDSREGILLEKILPTLSTPIPLLSYEWM